MFCRSRLRTSWTVNNVLNMATGNFLLFISLHTIFAPTKPKFACNSLFLKIA
jgi:hypothetical protein